MMKPVYLPEEQNDFIWAVIGSPWGLLALWLALINLTAFFVFGIDKWKAKRKASHESIRYGIPAILALQILVPLGLWVWWNFIR